MKTTTETIPATHTPTLDKLFARAGTNESLTKAATTHEPNGTTGPGQPAATQAIAVVPSSDLGLRASAPRFRNGKVARLPKLERDLVNRLLHSHVPYRKIVDALEEQDITVTERNISNWKTRGGYKEWCAEQEKQINLARIQDNLVDYLRKNDAVQVPEVGMQIAATQLSHTLLQPDMVQLLAASPEKYAKVVDMLCRLSTHIHALQKDRDQAVKHSAYRNTLEFRKREEERWIDTLHFVHTAKMGNSIKERDIPHRNDLPKRDKLNYPPVQPQMRSLDEILASFRNAGKAAAATPNPASNSAKINPTKE